MSRKTVEAIYPLSPQQQGMLFETLAAPRSGIHVEQLTCQLADDLDRGAFARAWRALLDRHAVLRSAFAWQDQAQPLQIVVRDVDMPLAEEDWRDLPAAAVADRLAAFLEADCLLGFKLTRPPLMRLTLLATGEQALSLVWTHHHILMDGWCRPVLLRELFTLYEALRLGREPELPPARPYQDYVAWLGRQDLRQAEAYWRQALRGFDHPTPLGRPLPAAAGGQPALYLTLRDSLPAAATAALQALAQQLRVTLSTMVQGAWALLLSRYSGSNDVAFGITVSGRPAELAGIEATIGLFINTLPLRVQVAPDEPLGRWLARLQAQTLELRRAEHVSSGQVHRWSEMAGALPLHESILVFENYPGAQAAPGSAPPHAPAEPGLPVSQVAARPAMPVAPADFGGGPSGTPGAPASAPPGTAVEPPPGARVAASLAGNGAGHAGNAGNAGNGAGHGAAAPSRGTGGQTRQPLTVLVAPGAELAVTLVHDSRRLRDAGSVLAQFLLLLREMAAGPERPLSCLTATVPEAEIPGFVPLARGVGVGVGGGAYVPPRTSGEEMLAILWSQVLGLHPVGIHDDFFSLGGHSLLAAQLVGLARDAFQADVPLRALFEHPTVAGLAAEIARLQGAGERYQEALADLPVVVPDPARRGEPFPLSDVQEAYWIGRGASFELGNVATHLYVETEIEDLDPARFERAWRRLIDRHDMLRAIVLADGRQQILPRVPPYEIAVADLRGAGAAAAEAALAAVREELSHQVVPADRWPLFEIRATRLAGWTRFHLSFDLLIGDAWSWLLLIGELGTLLRDPDAALPPLELSFRDYMLAVAALAGTPLHARSLAYWRARLATLPPGPDLPLAQSPAAIGRPRFARRRRFLAAPAWSALRERAARRGLTPSGLLLAAFAEALAGWSKTPRFTLNLTLFNRLPLHPQVNQVVGDFTSLVLLEVDAAADGTFAERARRTQRRLWDDLDHRYVSGVQVLRELGAAQGRAASLSMPVVFTSTLTLPAAAPPPAPPASPAGGGERPAPPASEGERPAAAADDKERVGAVRPVYSVGQTSQVWLDHQVAEQAGELVLTWDAIEELFPPGMLDDMLTVYLELLERLAAGEEAWGEAAPLRLPAAHLALYEAANATAAAIPAGLLHAPFLARAAERPESPAVIAAEGAGARTLSYGELLRLARGLGRRLRAAGAVPGELVAVVMTKGWEQAAAVLGVLAAGGAYLPVDAELPRERRDHLLAHGGARLALTQPRWVAALEWPEGMQVLALDGTEGEDGGWPEPPRDPRALAYTIFTSGSTGLPKGVMIDHRGALNTIADVNRRNAVGAGDRVLALSSLSFDLSVWDLFGLWAAGGAAVVPEAAAGRDPGRWLALMERHGVTVWNSVPALLEMLVEFAEGRGARLPATLRLVLCSGDWLPVALPARVRALAAGPLEVVSLGGATEASIWSILQPVGEVDPAWRSIPYGRPMANQTMQVLDAALAPRPLWATGELHIGGIGVARGYWRDPLRTAASFVPAPGAAERLYRTGDLGRWRPDGVIELLGRDDFQVKIQGHRIELGEIEAALRSHPGVESAVVSAVGEPPAGRRLAAHVVLNADGRRELAQAVSASASPSASVSAAAPPGIAAYLERKLGGGALRPLPEDALELAAPELDQDAVARLHLARRSFRDFAAGPVAAAALGRFLACLRQLRLGDHPLPKLRYGSAGSLYPVQVYLWVAPGRIDGVPAGTWYYHPAAHRLVPLAPGARIDPAVHAPVNRATFAGAAFSLFLVGAMDAIVPFYGERGRHYATLEAGAMTHLLETSAPACGLGLCQIGDLDFAAVRHLFGLGAEHELLHSLAGGPIDAARTGLAAFLEEAAAYRSLLDLAAARDGQAAAPPAQLAAGAALRAFLRGKLPEHLVPASFTILERLPLTANGKVDRAALSRLLPERPAAPPAPHAPPEPPRDRLEETIAALWREALHTAEVGIHDNFFTLGGHSVTMVRVYNRLRQDLGREIPLLTLFEHPTIAALARHLSGGAVASGAVASGSDRGDRRREAALERRSQGRRPAAAGVEDDDLG